MLEHADTCISWENYCWSSNLFIVSWTFGSTCFQHSPLNIIILWPISQFTSTSFYALWHLSKCFYEVCVQSKQNVQVNSCCSHGIFSKWRNVRRTLDTTVNIVSQLEVEVILEMEKCNILSCFSSGHVFAVSKLGDSQYIHGSSRPWYKFGLRSVILLSSAAGDFGRDRV